LLGSLDYLSHGRGGYPHSFGNFNERNPMIYYQTNRHQGSKIEKGSGLAWDK
jgi:hypothetical protein